MQAKRVLDFLSEDELNWQREWAEIKRVNDELTMLGASRREGIKEGIKQGIEQGILSERERMIQKIYKMGYSVEQISEIVEMPEKAVKLIVGEPVVI